jgi:hypothetical protein
MTTGPIVHTLYILKCTTKYLLISHNFNIEDIILIINSYPQTNKDALNYYIYFHIEM